MINRKQRTVSCNLVTVDQWVRVGKSGGTRVNREQRAEMGISEAGHVKAIKNKGVLHQDHP